MVAQVDRDQRHVLDRCMGSLLSLQCGQKSVEPLAAFIEIAKRNTACIDRHGQLIRLRLCKMSQGRAQGHGGPFLIVGPLYPALGREEI